MERTAKIESIVTDQGNGSSHCSACGAPLDAFLEARTSATVAGAEQEPFTCPSCGLPLVWGETHINRGGSDF